MPEFCNALTGMGPAEGLHTGAFPAEPPPAQVVGDQVSRSIRRRHSQRDRKRLSRSPREHSCAADELKQLHSDIGLISSRLGRIESLLEGMFSNQQAANDIAARGGMPPPSLFWMSCAPMSVPCEVDAQLCGQMKDGHDQRNNAAPTVANEALTGASTTGMSAPQVFDISSDAGMRKLTQHHSDASTGVPADQQLEGQCSDAETEPFDDDDYMTAACTHCVSDTEYYDRLAAASSSQIGAGDAAVASAVAPVRDGVMEPYAEEELERLDLEVKVEDAQWRTRILKDHFRGKVVDIERGKVPDDYFFT